MTLTDSGPLVSLIDEEDDGHEECLLLLPKLSAPMITTWPCFTEAMYLLGDSTGYQGQEELWGYLVDDLLMLHTLTEACPRSHPLKKRNGIRNSGRATRRSRSCFFY